MNRTQSTDNKNKSSEAMGAKSAHPLDKYTKASAPQQGSGGDEKSPFYKSQAPTIELPKGGGALKGIDEKFTVNAVNGTASLEVPLPLTPGRSGFTPSLSLQYNSGSGNSEFGLGWGLSLAAIQRKTDKKLPQYNDAIESDVFVMAGAEDLVPLLDEMGTPIISHPLNEEGNPTGYAIKQYRPRTEGLFARIERITKAGTTGSWWRVTTKENIVTYYGLTSAARVSDPVDEGRIFKWLPQLSYDHKGNVHEYHYAEDNNADMYNVPVCLHEQQRKSGLALFTNKYLKRVKYANTTPFIITDPYTVYQPALPSSPGYQMEVVFDYGEHHATAPTPDAADGQQWHCRKDPFSDFHAGFEVRTYRRCYRVLMFHHFSELTTSTGLSAVLVKSLDIVYANGNTTADAITFAEADMPLSFTSKGYKYVSGDYISKALPPFTCTYQPLVWDGTMHQLSPEDAENLPQGLTGPYQWIDLYGEGLPGILAEQGQAWYYKANLGEGKFAHTTQVAQKPSFSGLGNQLQWQDLNADGSRQLVSNSSFMPGYFELDDDQHWQNFRIFRQWPNVDWESPYTKMIDLDGDGKPDLLLTEENAWHWYQNNGTDGYAPGGYTSVTFDEDKGPRLLLNDKIQSIYLADMNGDGMTDLVRVRNSEVCYWPNLGYGRFGAKVTMSNTPVFDHPDSFNPLYLSLSDISGTGAPDIIYLGKNNCTAWINYAGNAFSEATIISPLPGMEPYSKIAVLDFLGSGTSCIVWSSPLPQHAHAPLRYIDLMGGNKPYLMMAYGNGMGKTTTLAYKHSTAYYIDDKEKGTPWATRLPFPVHCVQSITTTDSVSETTYRQSYTYHHGYYDHEEREFRGFGRVETLDTDTGIYYEGSTDIELDQPPVLTKTWYHTGAWMREATLISKFEEEYYNISEWNLPGLAAYPVTLNAQEMREAHRVLKGSMLRQEVYAKDGSDKEDIPYTITAQSYWVDVVQHLHSNRHASFLTHQRENIVWHCERYKNGSDHDARVLHDIILEIDDYGNILQSAKIAYRRTDLPTDIPGTTVDLDYTAAINYAQGTTKIIYTTNAFTNDVIEDDPAFPMDNYRLRLPYENKVYELHGVDDISGLFTVPDMLLAVHGDGGSVSAAAEIDYAKTPSYTVVEKRLLEHQRTLFLDDTIVSSGVAQVNSFGVLDALGIPYQQYALAYTTGTNTILDGTPATGTDLTATGGYLREDSITQFGSVNTTRYWLPAGTMQYPASPANSFYTPSGYKDPWGQITTVAYWGSYYMLPESVTDALGNITTVQAYDWRCLQPTTIKDPNNNITQILYDTLCMPVALAMQGKVTGSFEADELGSLDAENSTDITNQNNFWSNPQANAAALLGHATWRCVYDLDAAPVAVAMIAREQHWQDNNNSPMQIRISYSDGLGRLAMHKAQAPALVVNNTPQKPNLPNGTYEWVGSGKTVYNNKGKAVMQFEPYFSTTHAYDAAEQAAITGVSPRIKYDPLGRVQRTDLPDGSYTKTEWDAWTQTVYDNNDTVLDSDWYIEHQNANNTTHPGRFAGMNDASAKATEHDSTPTIMLLDVLAQPFYTIQHNRYITSGTTWGEAYYQSAAQTDVQGNRISVTDARGNMLTWKYNMLKSVVKQVSPDSGTQYLLVGADGQPLYAWDADSYQTYIEYDELRRQVKRSATKSAITTVLEVNVYGEDSGGTPANNNLLGQLYRQYDGAGMVEIPSYDFKGSPLSSVRRFTVDYDVHPNWAVLSGVGSPAMEVMPGGSTPLTYTTATSYDALGRPVTLTTPEGAQTTYTYDEGGRLFNVTVDDVHALDADIVDAIYYDAKGQRVKAEFANGATTTYTYDEATFRVIRIKTTKPGGGIAQDLNYWYDPVGNITLQTDAAQQTIFYNNTVASPDNNYTYDALYRLIITAGRELRASNTAPDYNDSARTAKSPVPYANSTTLTDTNAMRPYTQKYVYDAVGNMTQMKHIVDGSDNWTRNFTVATATNRTTGSSIGSGSATAETPFTYDNRGNMTGGLNHLTAMAYNAANRLEHIQHSGSIDSYYQYDGNGERVRKVVKNTTGTIQKTRVYVGGWELYTEKNYTTGTVSLKRETLHVMDDSARVVMIDTELDPVTNAVVTQVSRYQFTNHLSTAALELDESGNVISYEEYYPYGSTSFQTTNGSISQKRYKYTGKEKDEESGFYYHGARYYVPWLCRWLASDPLESKYAGMSSYNYGFNNPIKWQDADGMEPGENGDNKHVIEKGETLTKIAKENNVSVENLVKWNKINDPNKIIAGNEIIVKDPAQKESNKQKELSFGIKLGFRALIGTALSLYTGHYSTYAQVDPETMEALSEDQKQADFKSSAAKATGILMWEFATGTGPEHRSFDESHAITEELKWSESSRQAIWAMVKDFQSGKYKDGETRGYYAAMAPDKDISKVESFRRHANAYLSTPSTFYRGGLYYRMTKVGNDITVKVTDAYTVASMLTRDSKDNVKRDPNKITPLGNLQLNFILLGKILISMPKERTNMRYFLVAIIFCFQGCIFSGNEGLVFDIVNGYKIAPIDGNSSLILQHPDEETHTIILPENIDSIDWDNKYIYGYADQKYFIVDQATQIVDWSSNYYEFINNTKLLNDTILLKSVTSF